ncbi:unnamed protein product [Orchesella dallaii]|uniref:Uncharacterized protein n=1 Tax=Orchesella dallaii TaxID=48710 RepID=A0ABP1RTN3_9HEXA
MSILILVISLITVLPGSISFFIEECLNVLSKRVHLSKGTELAEVFQHYQRIFFITREMNKSLGNGIFIFHTIYNIQQTAQTYCIIQMLKAGASYADINLLFTDLFISASRIALSFHALSLVDNASQGFKLEIKRRPRKCAYSSRQQRKIEERTIRSLQNINMIIGPCACGRNFTFQGMSVYLDHYAAAALWP